MLRGRYFGYFFVVLGSLPTVIGLLTYLLQFLTGELLVKSRESGVTTELAIGQEISFVFFAQGQLFVAAGLYLAADSLRSRSFRGALALGSLGIFAMSFCALALAVTNVADLGVLLLPAWLMFILGCAGLARRLPGYRYGPIWEQLWEQRVESASPAHLSPSHHRPDYERAFRRFAEQHSGELKTQRHFSIEIPSSIRFRRGETEVKLESQQFLKLTFSLPEAGGMTGQIRSLGALESLLGPRDIALGWNVFDDQFSLQTNDLYQFRILVDREVQSDLLCIQQIARRYVPPRSATRGGICLAIKNGELQFRLRDLLAYEEALQVFYELSGKIFDRFADKLQTPS